MAETSLQQVPGWSAQHLERLKKSWITTAEQVVAVAATEGGVRSLSEQLKLSEADTERLVGLARAALAPAKRAEMDQPFSSDQRGMGAIGPRKEGGS